MLPLTPHSPTRTSPSLASHTEASPHRQRHRPTERPIASHPPVPPVPPGGLRDILSPRASKAPPAAADAAAGALQASVRGGRGREEEGGGGGGFSRKKDKGQHPSPQSTLFTHTHPLHLSLSLSLSPSIHTHDRRLKDLDALRGCPELRVLDLHACTRVEEVDALAECPSLEALNISGCW